jgi:hypothetical protein
MQPSVDRKKYINIQEREGAFKGKVVTTGNVGMASISL